jgi:hypothetical protein
MIRVYLVSVALGAAGACAPAVTDAPPTPPTTLAQVRTGGGCFAADECANGEVCVDPRYPVCGNIPACEEGGIRCGCSCVAACTATSCAADEVCSPSGCCQPRPCEGDAQCGSADARCVAGRCVRRGTCGPLPP